MEVPQPPAERSMIERIRNMWEFANLAQWIFIFGKAVKIDENLDIEVSFLFSHRIPVSPEIFPVAEMYDRNLKWNA